MRRGGKFYSVLFLQFISECRTERIIKIGPRSPKLSQKDCVGVLLTHGVYSATTSDLPDVVVDELVHRPTYIPRISFGSMTENKRTSIVV